MEQRDYFLRQLDQFGKALSQVISKLLGPEYNGNASLRMETVDQVLKGQLNITVNDLLEIPEESFLNKLENELGVSPNSFELLADALLLAENSSRSINRSLILLREVKERSSEFSLDREQKIDDLEKRL